MHNIVESIQKRKFNEARGLIEDRFRLIVLKKLLEEKKRLASQFTEANLSKEPVSKNVVDIRTDQVVQDSSKGNRADSTITADGKTDIRTTTISKNNLREARIRIIKARIRKGKVQRRKKISTVSGFRLSGTKLVRMSPKEKRNRKLGQRRGKIKRKAKLGRALMKRKRSLIRRKAMGL